MKTRVALLVAAAAVAWNPGAPVAAAADPVEDAKQHAMHALDEFMETFNARDPEAWAATLNYPHVRFASGTVRIHERAEEFAAAMDFDAFAKAYNWDHSEWDSREIIQAGPDKVHIAVTFTRYDPEGNPTKSHNSLYIVTLQDGHWGTQARSSFAP
jgi:hypothetical protein